MKKWSWLVMLGVLLFPALGAAQAPNWEKNLQNEMQKAAMKYDTDLAFSGIATKELPLVLDALQRVELDQDSATNMGKIYEEVRWTEQNEDESPEYITTRTYYMRDNKSKPNFYAVHVTTSRLYPQKDGASAEKLEYGEFQSGIGQNILGWRGAFEKLGANFAAATGNDKLKGQIMAFAKKYPLETIKDFSDYKVFANDTDRGEITAYIKVNLRNGGSDEVKLLIKKPWAVNGWGSYGEISWEVRIVR